MTSMTSQQHPNTLFWCICDTKNCQETWDREQPSQLPLSFSSQWQWKLSSAAWITKRTLGSLYWLECGWISCDFSPEFQPVTYVKSIVYKSYREQFHRGSMGFPSYQPARSEGPATSNLIENYSFHGHNSVKEKLPKRFPTWVWLLPLTWIWLIKTIGTLGSHGQPTLRLVARPSLRSALSLWEGRSVRKWTD